MDIIQLFLCDLAGTLIHPTPSVATQYKNTAQEILPSTKIPDRSTIKRRFHTSFTNTKNPPGYLRYGTTKTQGIWFWKRIIGHVFPRATDEALHELTTTLFDQFARVSAWTVADGARSVLSNLSNSSTKTALVSNWDIRGPTLLDRMSLEKYFDDLIFSSICGYEKPDPKIFAHTLEVLGCEGKFAFLLGDSIHNDLIPAKSFGIKTCYYTSDATGKWPLEISEWHDIQEYEQLIA